MTALSDDLAALLLSRYERYNRPSFIEDDPVCIPHRYTDPEDQAVAGFLTALIAWGRRPMILRSAGALMALMDDAPADFVRQANAADVQRFDGFVHRTFNGEDARGLILALRQGMQAYGSLEGLFTHGLAPEATGYDAISLMRKRLTESSHLPRRTHKHLADPERGASAKRINMFLRWMVRNDGRGVDLGLWKGLSPAQLIMPLDVHTGNVGRRLGLLTRPQDDRRAAEELTASLRLLDPNDPVKFDFALFGMGVNGEV